MIEIEAMLIAKIEQLTRQELFPSRKPDSEGERAQVVQIIVSSTTNYVQIKTLWWI